MESEARLADLYGALSLVTPRLVVRRAVEADREVLTAHERNPAIMAEIRDPVSEEVLRKRIDDSVKPWHAKEGTWVLFSVDHRLEGHQTIGIVAFRVADYSNAQVEFGYRLHPDWHGQGLALEATAALVDHLVTHARPHKLVAYCTLDNRPSYRLMERLGMTREGVFREHVHLRGRWRDDCAYGLLAREWTRPKPRRR